MKKFILSILVAAQLSGMTLDEELLKLSSAQSDILLTTFEKAEPFNLQWTMTAIAWQESRFGVNLTGWTTPDYGVFMINIKTYKDRYSKEIAKTGVTDEQIIEMLKADYDLNFAASLAEIKFWQGVYGQDKRFRIWASYNGGHKGNERYANAIDKKIKALKRYMALRG